MPQVSEAEVDSTSEEEDEQQAAEEDELVPMPECSVEEPPYIPEATIKPDDAETVAPVTSEDRQMQSTEAAELYECAQAAKCAQIKLISKYEASLKRNCETIATLTTESKRVKAALEGERGEVSLLQNKLKEQGNALGKLEAETQEEISRLKTENARLQSTLLEDQQYIETIRGVLKNAPGRFSANTDA